MCIFTYILLLYIRENPSDILANMLDCDVIVGEFKL